MPDGYADEGHVLVALKGKAARAVQKSRFAAYFAHDDRLGAFHHLAGYALAHVVHAPVLLRGGHAHAAINEHVAGFTVQQAYHAPRHAHLAAHVVQQAVQRGHDIVLFRKQSAHVEQERNNPATAGFGLAFVQQVYGWGIHGEPDHCSKSAPAAPAGTARLRAGQKSLIPIYPTRRITHSISR